MVTKLRYSCVLHIVLFFLLVDIQHTRCPRWFSILERYKLCGHKPTIQVATLYYSRLAVQCHAIVLGYDGATYIRQLPRYTERKIKKYIKQGNM